MAIQPTACYTKPFDEKEVARLIELGKRHFPILLSSNRFLYDEHTRSHFIQLFDTIKNFSFQNSDIDIITKAIPKFSMRADWFDFPRELSSFMLELLSVAKNKKILVPYAGLGYCVILAKVSGPIKYRMLIKMDSDVIFVVASLCDCLKFCNHKTSDVLRLAIYQIINGNWQNYEQGIMPQSQLAELASNN